MYSLVSDLISANLVTCCLVKCCYVLRDVILDTEGVSLISVSNGDGNP